MGYEGRHPDHRVIGCVHELLPLDGTPESLERVLRHECEHCEGRRVVVDLTGAPGPDGRHVEVMIDLIDPDEERWIIRLPPDTDQAVVDLLCDAGFEGHLIADDSPDQPHLVGRRQR